ncbi:hypothetical protein GCM10009785_35210 [Brooklawnia cerclae]|uniref:Lipoprotein n=1 Tax=Brooklawnia cerclae TaxID=349934 RepID=A0ABX0SBK2_9ACTN|nr:hypothetical protein [Brooklawnia cerclae]NIH55366.1 hypothetical protein [Brooklawnia cerclae]
MSHAALRLVGAGAAMACVLALTACSSAANDAAQAAYDACHKPDAKTDLFRLDGNTVHIEVKGDAAKTMAGGDDIAENLDTSGEFAEGDLDGFGIMAGMYFGVECLAEETGFPGSVDELRDGDEWDGWRYSEESGVGSEVAFSFESTL